MRALRRVASCLLVAAAVAGCRSETDATEILAQTADRLGEIRSGEIELALVVDSKSAAAADAGFELRGLFALGTAGSLPTMRVRYTEIAGERRRTVTVVSTSERAFVEVGGRPYSLPRREVEVLREAIRGLHESGGLEQLRLEEWVEEPELVEGGTAAGTATERVAGRLDVTRALDDLVELARPFAAVGLDGLLRDADLVRRAARSGTIDVYTGEKDRLLRKLRIGVDVGLDVPGVLRDALGAVVGANVRLELAVSRPNRRVVVREPDDPLPYSALVPSS